MSKIAEELRVLVQRFIKAQIPTRAAALAFHSILAVVPAIGISFAYLRVLGVTAKWRIATRAFILSHFDVGTGEEALKALENLTKSVSSRSTSIIVVLILSYTVFNLVRRLGDALDAVLHMSGHEIPTQRKFWSLMFRRSVVLLLLPISLTISQVATSWIREDSWFRFLFRIDTVGPILALPLSWVIDIAAIYALYAFLPRRRVDLRSTVLPAVVSGLLFEFGRALIGLYSHSAITNQKIYGAFAAIPLFLIWIQFAWILFLSGALLIKKPEK